MSATGLEPNELVLGCSASFETIGDNSGMARALLYLANVAADFGDAATAAARLERARSVARDVTDDLRRRVSSESSR